MREFIAVWDAVAPDPHGGKGADPSAPLRAPSTRNPAPAAPSDEGADIVVAEVLTLCVPLYNVGRFEERAEELVRRAKRLKLPTPKWRWGAERVERRTITDYRDWPPRPRRVEVRCREVTVEGPVVRIPGWRFLARIEHTEHGNILAGVPQPDDAPPLDLTPYRECPPFCAHCGKVRRRKDTFIIANEQSGALMQVGRTCLKDYMKARTIDAIAFSASFARDLADAGEEDPWSGEGATRSGFPLLPFLTMVVRLVAIDGYIGAKDAQEEIGRFATGDVAYRVLSDLVHARARGDGSGSKLKEQYRPTDEDERVAEAIIEWVASQQPTSDYFHNLKVAFAAGEVSSRRSRIVASAVPVYLRAVGREAERKKSVGVSAHVGAVGARLELPSLTLVWAGTTEGMYGTTHIFRFNDPSGNVITWFASNDRPLLQPGRSPAPLRVGDTYDLTATVKKHEVYRDVPQTQITRAIVQPAGAHAAAAAAKAAKRKRAPRKPPAPPQPNPHVSARWNLIGG